MYLLYPNVCIVCKRVLPFKRRHYGVCPECEKRLPYVGESFCRKCGKQLTTPLTNLCRDCRENDHEFAAGRSVFLYRSCMKNVMYRFKYSNARYMARFFAAIAKKKYGGWLRENGVEAVIPVPMYGRKKRVRGYNQAEVFGKTFASVMELPYYDDLVFRKRNTLPQKNLGREKRRENLKNAFKMRRYDVKLNCVLIVDDIYTTGTTMDALAHVLKESGIEKVLCLTICTGIDT